MLFKKEDGSLSAADIVTASDQSLTWSQFIDNFRASPPYIREKIVSKEPPNTNDTDTVFAAFVAATVEALCNEVGMVPPQWVFYERFILPEPSWGIRNIKDRDMLAKAQEMLRKETPREFASRNLFYGSNILSRI